ncbi:MAG: hypothetical protein Q9198_007812, partial [Flavoplaca austrocitrina]
HIGQYPELKSNVKKILSTPRHSSASREELKDVMGQLDFYQNQIEETLLSMVLPYLISDDQRIQVPKGGNTEESGWESVQFFMSGVASIVNCEFTRGYVPFRNFRHVVNPELGAQMTKLGNKDMSDPNPGRAYGRKDVVGADDRALVFATTYTDGLLDFHVHWAEVSQAEDALPIYNMFLVKSRSIMDLAQLRNARVTLHNILDWGSEKRLDDMEAPMRLHRRILEIRVIENSRSQETEEAASLVLPNTAYLTS